MSHETTTDTATAIDPALINIYLKELQQEAKHSSHSDNPTEALMDLIERHRQRYSGNELLTTFFDAERDFYNRDYENALKGYIQAKDIPHYQFFCYRASSYIAARRHHDDQAEKLARKALAMQQDDPYTIAILEQIMQKGEHHATEAQESHKHQNHTTATHEGHGANDNLTKRYYAIDDNTQETQRPHHSYKATEGTQRDIAWLPNIDQMLEMRIRDHQRHHSSQLAQYLKKARTSRKEHENFLNVFHGWTAPSSPWSSEETQETPHSHPWLLGENMKPSHGLFLQWNGHGIVINPGRNFLQHFHKSGLHITDINSVIITHADPQCYSDIEEIYSLNYQLNKISSDLHIIHYYLNHKAFLELSPILKPHFKQERHAIHCLELFVDSPDVEKVELSPDIALNYFPTATQEALMLHAGSDSATRKAISPLGIRLDLRRTPGSSNSSRNSVKVGYISATAWSPLLGHHLGHCDLLFAGFGSTNSNDYGKLAYNDTCLGYYGTFSLAEEVKPAMLLCCEFDGREGDLRLEVCQKLRQDLKLGHQPSSSASDAGRVVLPADNGMHIDLDSLKVRCSVSHHAVDPQAVKVVKMADSFQRLLFVAPSCLLE